MNIVHIKIIADNEKPAPLIEAANEKTDFIETEETNFTIMEKATAGGQIGVFVILKTGNNMYVTANLTGNNFEALIGAYLGAKQRFNK